MAQKGNIMQTNEQMFGERKLYTKIIGFQDGYDEKIIIPCNMFFG